jgi:hypothetical protein
MTMRRIYVLVTFAIAAFGLPPAPTGATTLTMENVINRVPGNGPAQPDEPFATFGFYAPGLINPADGQPYQLAGAPGQISRFPAGFPRDEPLVNDIVIYNNTAYNITSLTLRIVGSAVEPQPFNFTFTLDPNVSAFWGDVNGDGKIGISDIFETVTLAADHRTVTFSDGLIPVGGRFTDSLLSITDNGEPFKAGINASFDGFLAVPVPEPATWSIFLTGLSAAGIMRWRTLRPRS